MEGAGSTTAPHRSHGCLTLEAQCWFALMYAALHVAAHAASSHNYRGIGKQQGDSNCLAQASRHAANAIKLTHSLDKSHVYRVVALASAGSVQLASGSMQAAAHSFMQGAPLTALCISSALHDAAIEHKCVAVDNAWLGATRHCGSYGWLSPMTILLLNV